MERGWGWGLPNGRGQIKFYLYKKKGKGEFSHAEGEGGGVVFPQKLEVLAILKGGGHKRFPHIKRRARFLPCLEGGGG